MQETLSILMGLSVSSLWWWWGGDNLGQRGAASDHWLGM